MSNGRSWVAAPTPGGCGAHGKRMLTKAHVARSYTGLVTRASARQERYQILAAILAIRFPEKAPEFLVYQASIVRAERNYEGCQWVLYDRQYRREALARRDLNWSVPDTRLYNKAFTGRARAIPMCSYYLSDDHLANNCPVNPGATSNGMDLTPIIRVLACRSHAEISMRASAGG